MSAKVLEFRDKSVHVVLPKIAFTSECGIRVGSQNLSIRPQSRQARVLRFFWNDPTRILRRRDLIDIVHDETGADARVTVRFEKCLWGSSNQVLCRLRRTLSFAFAGIMPAGTEWLPYSEVLEGWILYKLPAYGSDGCWH